MSEENKAATAGRWTHQCNAFTAHPTIYQPRSYSSRFDACPLCGKGRDAVSGEKVVKK